jgi:transposase
MIRFFVRCEEAAMAIDLTRNDLDSRGLRVAASACRDGAASRRMLALALILEGESRTDAARVCGMDRQTLRDWVHRYNAEGLAGLTDRYGGGRAALLNAAQQAEFRQIVLAGPDRQVDGVVRWRCVDLQRVIGERFGVTMAERTVGKLLGKLGLSRLTARPRHPKQEAGASEDFKKTSPPS